MFTKFLKGVKKKDRCDQGEQEKFKDKQAEGQSPERHLSVEKDEEDVGASKTGWSEGLLIERDLAQREHAPKSRRPRRRAGTSTAPAGTAGPAL